MGVGALEVELFGPLFVRCLDDLAHRADQAQDDLGQFSFLFAAGEGEQLAAKDRLLLRRVLDK